MIKIGTQDQAFFPSNFVEKFNFLKNMGFDGFEIDGKVLVEHFEEIKKAQQETGMAISSACNGYNGWIGDIDEQKRQQAIDEISLILEKLSQLGGSGIVLPAAWGMWSYPHFTSFPRTNEEDFMVISESLRKLNEVASQTNTFIYLEPLNRYQDHMINTLSDSKKYIETNQFSNVKIIADFYHMNQEEDDISESIKENREYVKHIHLADNHRYAPGTGSIDFKKHFNTLKSINYSGWMVYECLMRGDDFEKTYQESIEFIKECLK
ncbi:sugar phosphate isomerase/epimerase [Streptococcus uberis]|nr:sugar phosphate isomerase/epimerase family protein [Streptococcus uberis]MCK1242643.1 sugar phosphate isomerase/epimerase [Streptococcus uberis]